MVDGLAAPRGAASWGIGPGEQGSTEWLQEL